MKSRLKSSVRAQTRTLATRTLHRNAHMTFPKSNSTMFLKSRAGRANLDTKFPKPFAWLSVMMSALWGRINTHKSPRDCWFVPLIFTLGTRHISQSISWKTRGGEKGINLPARYVATQYDAKALQESWEELVYGHVRSRGSARRGAVGDVLPMDQHIVISGLHCYLRCGGQRAEAEEHQHSEETNQRLECWKTGKHIYIVLCQNG